MTIKLEGQNLGDKHKHLNYLASKSEQTYNFENINIDDSDVINLIKIDIASRNKQLDYILKVLICDDLLYVSKAIKQCPWLVTDEYKYIINPEYLHGTLYPQMTSKAAGKLTKYIKLHLKDSARVEEFYKHEDDPKKAAEWLPHCSVEFINSNINKHINHIDITLLKRLCERSPTVLEDFAKNNDNFSRQIFKQTTFLLKHNMDMFLNIVEKQPRYMFPNFNKYTTELLMKQSPDRIFKKFKLYCNNIHIPTFLRYLKKENIKKFLLNIFNEKESSSRRIYFEFEILTQIISYMPDDERIEFITQVLIDKIHMDDKCVLPVPLKSSMHNVFQYTSQFKYIYLYDHFWYRYTPFEIAFSKIKEQISNQTPYDELTSMFSTLTVAAAGSTQDLKSLINFYVDTYKQTNQIIKTNFIKLLLSKNKYYNFDEKMWSIVEDTFMRDILKDEVNEDEVTDEDYVQTCVEAIIVYYTLHKKKLPKTVENKYKFNSMKSYRAKLNKEDNDILFTYLYNTIIRKINSHPSSTKEEFLEKIELLKDALDLLIDWSKDLGQYPAVVNAIRDLININEQNKWLVNFTDIYNKKKTWRKVLFQESLKMHPSQPVLMNIIKHDPELLERFPEKVDNIYFDNKIFLQQYHKKIKIYWPDSLGKQLINKYIDNLDNTNKNKAVIRALCILLPKEDLRNIITEYAPVDDKIDWNNSKEHTLITRQNLAKIMHIARPQPSPCLILKYCKQDYLPYALPSLYSIFTNLNFAKSQQFIPNLLNTNKLQKHGIRFAFLKLPPEDVKNILGEILEENKNISMRHIAFKLTFKLLCKEKDAEKSKAIWYIMESFLDKITDKENDSIYELLLKVQEIPTSVRHLFYMKSYNIFQNTSVLVYEKFKYTFESIFIRYAREIIDELCPEFVTKLLSQVVLQEEKDFLCSDYIDRKLDVISSFLLSSDKEESQMDKYNNFMLPLLQKCYKHWNDLSIHKNYAVRINLDNLLDILRKDVKEIAFNKNKILPTKLFSIIQTELLNNLDYTTNYLLLTKWHLTVTFVDHLNKNKENDWDKACEALATVFSDECRNLLKNHCDKYFCNIYVLFAKALYGCVRSFISNNEINNTILKKMLQAEHNVQVYLTVLKVLEYFYSNSAPEETHKDIKELFKIISDHPSTEVQIHYYHCRNVYLKSVSEDIFISDMKKIYTDVSKK